MTTTVGMIGLGIMGGAMARNVVAAGFDVVGYDVVDAATARARDAGVRIAASVRDVAAAARLVVTSLPQCQGGARNCG